MVYLKILIKLLHLLLSFIFFWSLIFDSIDWVRFLLLNVFLMWPDIMYYLPCHPDNPHITTDSWVPAHLYKWVLPKANILFSSLVSPPRWVVRAVSLQPGKKNFLLVLCKISGVFLEIRGENYFSVFFFNFSKESTRWQVIAEVQDFVFLYKSCCTGDVSKSSLPC